MSNGCAQWHAIRALPNAAEVMAVVGDPLNRVTHAERTAVRVTQNERVLSKNMKLNPHIMRGDWRQLENALAPKKRAKRKR